MGNVIIYGVANPIPRFNPSLHPSTNIINNRTLRPRSPLSPSHKEAEAIQTQATTNQPIQFLLFSAWPFGLMKPTACNSATKQALFNRGPFQHAVGNSPIGVRSSDWCVLKHYPTSPLWQPTKSPIHTTSPSLQSLEFTKGALGVLWPVCRRASP